MKYLTENDVKWKTLDDYLYAKNKLKGKIPSQVWRDKYSCRKSIGSCVHLCNKFKPKTYEEFYEKYLKSGAEDIMLDKKFRGRTVDELEQIAYNWKTDVGDNNTPLSVYYDGVIVHAIVETLQGVKYENELINQLVSSGYTVEHGSDAEDSEMGIDIKVYKEGGLKYLLQLKPISFIVSKRPDTKRDRVEAFRKHKKAHDKYPNVSLYYLIYNKWTDNWIVNASNNSCFFKYEELVDADGKPLKSEKELNLNERPTLT